MNGQSLVRCGDMWCTWQAEGSVAECPYRGGACFKFSYCKLYSTPGPHSPSKIAKVVGESLAKVNDIVGRAHRKIAREKDLLLEAQRNPTDDEMKEVA